MRVALIPPIRQLYDTYKTDIQLLLPMQFITDREYASVYLQHLRDPRQYVILDNGAAEADEIEWDELIRIIIHYQPNEFALPDVLGDSAATVENAIEFIQMYSKILEELVPATKVGLVAQGTTIQECFNTVRTILNNPITANFIDVIYLPRLLIKETSDPYARIKLFNGLYNTYDGNFEYHLFGASPYWPGEVQVASTLTGLRSIDTSLPYQFAAARKELIPVVMREEDIVSRPANYFHTHTYIADFNVGLYLRWAGLL